MQGYRGCNLKDKSFQFALKIGWRAGFDKYQLAERVGFEPSVAFDDTRSPGVPDRPLQHLSRASTYYDSLCEPQ